MDKVIISKGYNSLTGECSSEFDTPPVSQIIDGVDVSGCEFLDGNYCKLCDMRAALDELIVHRQYCDRTVNNSCYYKQLQRLKASNNNLKLQIETYNLPEVQKALTDWRTGELDLQANKLKKLEAENEQLKHELDNAPLGVLDIYKQALQEIREIINFRFKTSYMTFGYKKYDKLIKDIYKIVNEVIGAGE